MIIFMGIFFVGGLWTLFSQSALADDDEDEQEYEEDRRDVEDDVATTADQKEYIEETVVTEKVIISDTVSQNITTIVTADNDGDGIFDKDDKYPTVNDHFIVVDDDRNGIVDSYENGTKKVE